MLTPSIERCCKPHGNPTPLRPARQVAEVAKSVKTQLPVNQQETNSNPQKVAEVVEISHLSGAMCTRVKTFHARIFQLP